MLAAGDEVAGEAVRVERRGDRAVVTLADPERLNALSAPLVAQLEAALTELAADRDLRAIVLTGGRRPWT
jgi:2-(1,2-epoxy-1,2-dihydrophenyl)acetyl-CoA isomerase